MEAAQPVLEDTRFRDVVITHVALILGKMIVLFRFDAFDFICKCVTAEIYIVDRCLEVCEGRVVAAHDGRVGDSSRNEAESASNAIGFPTLGIDVMGSCSDRFDTRMPAPCHIHFTSFVIDSYRLDLLEFLDTVQSASRRHTRSMLQEYLYRGTGLDRPRCTEKVPRRV